MRVMHNQLKVLRWHLGFLIRKFKYNRAPFRVLARTACMGQEVMRELGWFNVALNHQKSRMDYLLKFSARAHIKPRCFQVEAHLKEKGVGPFIYQQTQDFWKYKAPSVIFLDSYAELTDQLFINRQMGWQFLVNYGDINHSPDFENDFECQGLLNLDDLEECYSVFFSKIKAVYGSVPVIFLHFSTKLDNREKFKIRGQKILEIMSDLASQYQNIYSISVDDDVVDWSEFERGQECGGLPYHFHTDVFKFFAGKIRLLNIGDKTCPLKLLKA